jgi:hypothetical protein
MKIILKQIVGSKKILPFLSISSLQMNWSTVISNNAYIQDRSSSCVDEHSFCSLVKRPLSQSENIRLGIAMEHLFRDAIAQNQTGWKSAAEKNKKGEHQKDHIWVHEATKRIIYAEQKNNITLDTEKSKKTAEKINEVANTYPGYTLTPYLLAARYLSKDEPLVQERVKKFPGITIIGVNDFLSLFELPKFQDYNAYKAVIEQVVDTKFQ